MEKHYFYFKGFKLWNRDSAFKINTDGVLLGCWAQLEPNQNILEVGTGTSVIAHLLSFRMPSSKILAIDIDEESVLEAQKSVRENQIGNIKVEHIDFSNYHQEDCFDHIISNPPYFNNSTSPKNLRLESAKHSISLNYELLISKSAELLSEHGRLSVIIPSHDENTFIKMANNNHLYPSRILRVSPRIDTPSHRSLLEFTNNESLQSVDNKSIYMHEEGRNNYSEAYKAIVGDYYLNM